MRAGVWFISLLFKCSAAAGIAAEPSNAPGLLDFVAANRDRHYADVPREVLAFYYTWYGRPENHGRWIHWGGEDKEARDIPESTNYPARGAYDSHDPDLIEAHIAEAKAHGVTGFIATWWGRGTFDDRAFQLLLDHADKQDFKVTIYWETAPGRDREQVERAVDDLVYVLNEYGGRPSFLKLDGKPVIFVYGRVMSEVPLASWPAIIDAVRAKAGDLILIADGYTESFARVFDGMHIYNNCAEVAGRSPAELREWSVAHYANAVKLARRQGKISCATVIPGYDDRKIRTPGLNAARQGGRTYRVLWEEAMKAEPDWILITSWNEWHEGSEIEPSWEDGDRYLKLTAEYAPRFLAREPVSAGAVSGRAVTADDKRRLRELFKGPAIGLLPDFGDVAFWLLDAGLPVKELSWADVVDSTVLNPRTFPVLLHAGGERYPGRVKADGDLLPALQRYVGEGGFLVSMPQQPFPFYYDDTPGQPRVIANQIGLPVQQGWEHPPDGAELTFQFNTNELPGLPAMAPFPTVGDLRWRPANRTAIQPDDLYLALATLTDADGRDLGEGIAYVEQRTPPLQGGQTLYVWMRMGDAVGSDALMSALFEFVGGRIQR